MKKWTQIEIDKLLRQVILGFSRGESIRGICWRLGVDLGGMLRCQNKYRSILQRNPALIDRTVQTLEDEGYFVNNPATARKARQFHQQTNNVIEMPAPVYNNLSDQDITNLFMGLVRLVRKQSQSQIDRLKDEIERLKVASLRVKPQQSLTH